MAKHNIIGKRGEHIAHEYLIINDYEVLEKNWRHGKAEIDLIVKKDGILIFVEVKTRTNLMFGAPESFVNDKKEDLISSAASVYMEQIGHDWEIRFDVISIIEKAEQSHEIKHIKDAFFPGLEE